ncbi:hypothetical protein [uncultured Jannaschia sp.]|uniref:hypothetical protein n=1 Tax=uncultured Jannaschia sp. TaxID=293347 RepID=UPI00260DF78C|nr:hypothetical protein [uncultured Jannaschia sp.]
MTRILPVLFALLPSLAFADAHSGDVAPLSCEETAAGVACTVETVDAATFCMAIDAEGTPIANATGVLDDGIVLFQQIDPNAVAALRCRTS